MSTTIKIDGTVQTLKDVFSYSYLENCSDVDSLDLKELQKLADSALHAEELKEELKETKENNVESLTEIKENIYSLVELLEADTDTDPNEALVDILKRYKTVTEKLDELDTKLAEFLGGYNGDVFEGIDV